MFMKTPSNLSPCRLVLANGFSRREPIEQGTGRRLSRLADSMAMAL
jgi:hypothetical protein